jgi:hypothetical protein
MSNIFYSEVDRNLQLEMNARGRSGFYDRSERALNFMLGKIANVEMTAFEGNDTSTRIVGVLGGSTTRTGRFMPSGPDGYLTNPTITQDTVDYFTERHKTADPNNKDIVIGNAYVKPYRFVDSSGRTGPYLETIDITIGDHSMGLLNSATIKLVIPNPQRDLDEVEQIWFRPGRYAKIVLAHSDSILAAKDLTGGYLQPKSDSFWQAFTTIYPKLKFRNKKDLNKLFKMNEFAFEGLITDFDFAYTSDGTVTATLGLRGTSNVYTDVSLFIKKSTQPQNPQKQVSVNDIKTNAKPEFYAALHDRIKKITTAFVDENKLDARATYLCPFTTENKSTVTSTDQFILVGEPYNPSINGTQYRDFADKSSIPAQTNFNRYITLAALIEFINDHVLTKMEGNVVNPIIVCNDRVTYSNYYDSIVSCDPENILLLPKNINIPNVNFTTGTVFPDCNVYGNLIYYPSVFTRTEWPGAYEKGGVTGKLFPSRIFLNIEMIQDLVTAMSEKETKAFTVATLLAAISTKIEKATGNAIQLRIVTHPDNLDMLMFADTQFVKNRASDSTATVVPYSFPMFSNHPNGSAVKEFSLSAKMPDNLKNLSYVLNQGDDLTEAQIAPYMNFMFNAQNKEQLAKLTQNFRSTHEQSVETLARAKKQFGNSPGVPEHQQALYKALAEYVKHPVADWRTAQQMTAPLYPFEASVTLDGIQGFRYGDVVQFDALPLRYRRNTVFSIMSVTHTVSSTGEWTTGLKCMMRPSIE